MAKRKNAGGPFLWWERAYDGIDHIEPAYELVLGKDTLTPGIPVRIKNQRGIFLFRCFAKNTNTGSEWADFIGPEKQWHSYRVDKIKGMVKPKKFRRKTPK